MKPAVKPGPENVVPKKPRKVPVPDVVVPPDVLLLDLFQAAAFAGLTIWQIRGLLQRGELKPTWVGDKQYIRRVTLIEWAKRAEANAA